jgi:hypothetical protein
VEEILPGSDVSLETQSDITIPSSWWDFGSNPASNPASSGKLGEGEMDETNDELAELSSNGDEVVECHEEASLSSTEESQGAHQEEPGHAGEYAGEPGHADNAPGFTEPDEEDHGGSIHLSERRNCGIGHRVR